LRYVSRVPAKEIVEHIAGVEDAHHLAARWRVIEDSRRSRVM
jgi:hypothetical protein